MKPYLRHTTAILLFAIAGPNLANAQTLMDYVVSREQLEGAEEVPPPPGFAPQVPPAGSYAAPVNAGSGWQSMPTCAVPAGPSYVTEMPGSCVAPQVTPGCGWQSTPTWDATAGASYVTEMPGSCVAPPACRPRSMTADVCYTTEPTCAIPCTPSRSASAPAGCRCQRDGCHCRNGSQCHGGSKRRCCCCCCSGWSRAHTTGDLFPHFPYQPEHGGYYYFRPYNWETVHEHVARASQWGLHTGNPYSVSMFDVINEDFAQRYPQGVSIPKPPLRHERPLPNLEDLVKPLP